MPLGIGTMPTELNTPEWHRGPHEQGIAETPKSVGDIQCHSGLST